MSKYTWLLLFLWPLCVSQCLCQALFHTWSAFFTFFPSDSTRFAWQMAAFGSVVLQQTILFGHTTRCKKTFAVRIVFFSVTSGPPLVGSAETLRQIEISAGSFMLEDHMSNGGISRIQIPTTTSIACYFQQRFESQSNITSLRVILETFRW